MDTIVVTGIILIRQLNIIKSTECMIVILGIILSFLLQHFEKKNQIIKDAIKQLKSLQLTGTLIYHLLYLDD